MGAIISFFSRNWKILSLLFVLGGTATVVSVVPGMEPVRQTVESGIDAAKTKLVSATESVAP